MGWEVETERNTMPSKGKKDVPLLAKLILVVVIVPIIVLSLLCNIVICLIGTPIILIYCIKFGKESTYKERLVGTYKKILLNIDSGFYGL